MRVQERERERERERESVYQRGNEGGSFTKFLLVSLLLPCLFILLLLSLYYEQQATEFD